METPSKQEIEMYRTKWLTALRSGKYKQCQKALRKADSVNESFCCLGVFCEISGLGNFSGPYGPDWFEYKLQGGKYNAAGYLNSNLIRLLDINNGIQMILSEMNDNGKTFEEIADYLEKLFKENPVKNPVEVSELETV